MIESKVLNKAVLNTPDLQDLQDPLRAAIIRTLLYFDIFKHPLMAKEICQLINIAGASQLYIHHTLRNLCEEGAIQHHHGMYFINHGPEITERRRTGEIKSSEALKKAQKYSRLISNFPYVRGICISGSLSKNYMDEHSDIDYFIITSPERMWLTRTLLALYKKVFLLNSRKYFCINYFITEETLEIPDRNLFIATELAFVLPTYNYELYRKLMEKNSWYKEYYPNLSLRDDNFICPMKKQFIKRISEQILNSRLGNILDNICFKITLNYWRKKFSHFDPGTFDQRLRSRKNESKHHPLGFQKKVMDLFEKNIREYESSRQIDISIP